MPVLLTLSIRTVVPGLSMSLETVGQELLISKTHSSNLQLESPCIIHWKGFFFWIFVSV